MSKNTPDLTAEEWQLAAWALSYVTGVAQEMQDDETGRKAWLLEMKIRTAVATPGPLSPLP